MLPSFKYGVTEKFEETLAWQFVPSLNFSEIETQLIDAEISKLLHNGVIVHMWENQMTIFQDSLQRPKNKKIMIIE